MTDMPVIARLARPERTRRLADDLLTALPLVLAAAAVAWRALGIGAAVAIGLYGLIALKDARRPFFIALASLAVVVLAVMYRSRSFAPPWPRAGFFLLLPGVLGNLTDRIVHGHVVDFLLFDLHVRFAHPWPAFNVADSCICVAVGCFLVGSWQDARRPS